jgi:hypothetical protein
MSLFSAIAATVQARKIATECALPENIIELMDLFGVLPVFPEQFKG